MLYLFIHKVDFSFCLFSSQSTSAAWMGGFGAQPAQGQGAPVIPNQAGYGMASYQTQ